MINDIYSVLVLFELSNCIDWINVCYIVYSQSVTDQDIVFLVPDPCWATVRIGNSRNAEVTEDTNKKLLKQHLFLLFLDNLTVVFSCLTLQDKHNIRTLSENIKYICKRLAFLPISKTCTNKSYIFQQCTYIVYLYQ